LHRLESWKRDIQDLLKCTVDMGTKDASDSWKDNIVELPKNGKPYINTSQFNKSLRGCSWNNNRAYCLAGYRNFSNAGIVYNFNGFRVVCL
jgi:formylglycine-generating enzyme required for sulfatase activity